MSNKKQTAVKYLYGELASLLKLEVDPITALKVFDIYQKSLEIEKGQMKDIYSPPILENDFGQLYFKTFEKYYKETYE